MRPEVDVVESMAETKVRERQFRLGALLIMPVDDVLDGVNDVDGDADDSDDCAGGAMSPGLSVSASGCGFGDAVSVGRAFWGRRDGGQSHTQFALLSPASSSFAKVLFSASPAKKETCRQRYFHVHGLLKPLTRLFSPLPHIVLGNLSPCPLLPHLALFSTIPL